MDRSFKAVHTRKPKASRDSSSEVYLLGLRRLSDAELAREPLNGAAPGCDSPG